MNDTIQELFVSETKLSKATNELRDKNAYIKKLEDKYVNKEFESRVQQTYEYEFLESRIKIATVAVQTDAQDEPRVSREIVLSSKEPSVSEPAAGLGLER